MRHGRHLLAALCALCVLWAPIFAEGEEARPAAAEETLEASAFPEAQTSPEEQAPAEEENPVTEQTPEEEAPAAEQAPEEEAPEEEQGPEEEAPVTEQTPEEATPEEEQAPEEETPETVYEAGPVAVSGGDGDTEDLFYGYLLERAGGKPGQVSLQSTGTETAGSRLTGLTKTIYDRMAAWAKKVAAGEITSTVFSVTPEELGIKRGPWTAEELGVSAIVVNNAIAPEASSAIYALIDYDEEALLDALRTDLPYELYWFDKTTGNANSRPSITATGSSSGYRLYFADAPGKDSLTIIMAVAEEYAGSATQTLTFRDSEGGTYTRTYLTELSVSQRAANAVDTAIANARSVVAAWEGRTAYEKLRGYRDAIRARVSYNTAAAADASAPYGNPWQLIYVFDGDSSTNVVCEGYSKAFQFLCDLTDFGDEDVQCYSMEGYMQAQGEHVNGEGPHMWNLVNINGKSYLADITNYHEASGALFLSGAADQSVQDINAYNQARCTVRLSDSAWMYYYYTPYSVSGNVNGKSNMAAQWGVTLLTLETSDYPHYTVTVNPNNGEASATYEAGWGETLSDVISAPTRANSRFEGWYSGSAPFALSTPVTSDLTLTARWTAVQTYSVTFDANGGTPVPGSQTVYAGETASRPADPARSGYRFDGWYNGSTLYDFSAPVNGNLTLTARWTALYTVTFDADGGTPAPASQTVEQGQTATRPTDPARSGCRFDGWYNGSTLYNFSAPVNGNLTLTARWVALYTVTFDADGGTPAPASQTVEQGQTATRPADPARSGYRFDGWYNGSTLYDFSAPVNGNLTLTARWTALYTVTFDANGGTGTPSPQTKEENVPLTLTDFIPAKSYTLYYNANGGSVSPASKNAACAFAHWNTAKNGGGTAYASGGSYTANADATLYAQWTDPAAGTLAAPSRSGYVFDGWFTSADGGTRISETSAVHRSMTLYAHWTNPYNLGEETYSFRNYEDSDSRGHCFGMSITSAGYYTGLLDIGLIGGTASTPLHSFDATKAVKQMICYYQSIQGHHSKRATVAGGSFYLSGKSNILSDWPAVVNYVKNHEYDGTGLLQIGFRQGVSGHAVNFLRYETVNGQDRLYAYDNNFPDRETYFYRDSSGDVWQAPVATFSGAIDCIALRDCRTYFSSIGDFDATHVLYMPKDAATVQGYSYSYMESDASEEVYVMYEIPADQEYVTIIPNRDYADFIYMDTEYSFGKITDKTYGKLEFASTDEEAGSTEANFQIFEDAEPALSVTLDNTTLRYEIANFDPARMVLVIADYEASGKMLSARQITPESGSGSVQVPAAARHRAFLLDRDTLTPLCSGWDSGQSGA